MMLSLDQQLAISFNELATHSIITQLITATLAEYYPYIILIVIITLAWRSKVWTDTIIRAVFAGLFARFVVKEAILPFVHRARPSVAFPDIHKLAAVYPQEAYQSFPSGHAIFFFALVPIIYRRNKKWGHFFLASAIVISVARVAAGVHFPSDIIAGAILGTITGYSIERAVVVWRKKK